jgi:pimeloyl-ACP methyl ester carboxylesterase
MCAAPTQYRIIDGLKVRFAESDPRDDHALVLSPWPESLCAFDQMWGRLAEDAHLVAVDLTGFGHSERLDTLLAPRAMGEFVIKVADKFGRDASTPVDDSVTDANDEAVSSATPMNSSSGTGVPSRSHRSSTSVRTGVASGSETIGCRAVHPRPWSAVERGGHFAASEQPALFADEVRGAFRSLR